VWLSENHGRKRTLSRRTTLAAAPITSDRRSVEKSMA
jgi:hypothetical protein